MAFGSKELMGASTALAVLGVLRRGSTYGYDIVRQINERAPGDFTWQEGTIYPLLHKLERQGLVRSRWQESEGATGNKKRKYYLLTPQGREALRAGAAQWDALHDMLIQLLGVAHG